MKIYNEIIIDMNPESPDFEKVMHEDSFEYEGELALCVSYHYEMSDWTIEGIKDSEGGGYYLSGGAGGGEKFEDKASAKAKLMEEWRKRHSYRIDFSAPLTSEMWHAMSPDDKTNYIIGTKYPGGIPDGMTIDQIKGQVQDYAPGERKVSETEAGFLGQEIGMALEQFGGVYDPETKTFTEPTKEEWETGSFAGREASFAKGAAEDVYGLAKEQYGDAGPDGIFGTADDVGGTAQRGVERKYDVALEGLQGSAKQAGAQMRGAYGGGMGAGMRGAMAGQASISKAFGRASEEREDALLSSTGAAQRAQSAWGRAEDAYGLSRDKSDLGGQKALLAYQKGMYGLEEGLSGLEEEDIMGFLGTFGDQI